MYNSISAGNKNISVRLEEYMIDIINDDQVFALVTEMPEATTDELVLAIKKEYHAQFDKDFSVSDKSMAVEIWGHVFAEEFADAVERITSVKLVDEVAEKIVRHCEVINIGEKGHDNNRFVWDDLAPFKSAIADLLLKRTK
jgi:hypothetical protein